MSYSVSFLPDANRDMDDIEEYLSKFYPSTARNFFTQLKKQLQLLESMPLMCPIYDADPFFRKMIVDDYLLFYSVDEKRALIIIHRIFHAKRDINQQIMKQH
jgi:plasmid stabilization system protein ParE